MDRDGENNGPQTSCLKQLVVCTNHRASPNQPSCSGSGGGEALAEKLETEIAARGWNIKVSRFPCLGYCEKGPVVKLSPGGGFICEIDPDNLDGVLQQIEAFSQQSD
ncbi:(2Fe-2S) ferredoxin domain-containing protein [Mariprofundus sp. NF]|uniref:(2Fe-2S) ferredoxin domain-containing protein n=1 Tax=Mariprofundus sp. NF TaxID=2608716 RepID=UPI0015A2B525|nr:(2Fe-2S) ferredoxin domain-containing protein [Mariprofundus sp. NF]NWF39106.1 (2Fe-2S) ferredoxin domain-containing protein [Mariprofundus sp. NF]